MKLDHAKVIAYLAAAREVEEELAKYEELFDKEMLYSFGRETQELKQNYEMTQQDARKLSIGVVGAVKAGKSSFLNTCIFGGKDFLPKAATPMTAALTKLSYADTPKAVIHFYDRESWEQIETLSQKYDERIDADYETYKQDMQKTQERMASKGYYSPMQIRSKEEFERSHRGQMPEEQRGAKELTSMLADQTLLEQLGETVELKGDVMSQLQAYVGANGRYTPIVSYVELLTNEKCLEDIEIVDTPGLNDPVASRGRVTKRFLRNCDVSLLLSPCSQFMDAHTAELMANSLPENGVREILVIGSKLDSGILNEQVAEFGEAYKKALSSYRQQFGRTLAQMQSGRRGKDIIDKMRAGEAKFVSSICYTIAQKLKKKEPLNEEEQHVLRNLHRFHGFEEKMLSSLSGITAVQKALNEVLERKAAIIDEKNSDLLSDAQNRHAQILEQIRHEITSSREKLETASAEELYDRQEKIRDTIDSARVKLMNAFESAAIDCDNRIKRLLPELGLEKKAHREMKIDSETHTEYTTRNEGFLGLKKVTKTYEITDYEVDTTEAKQNIENYANACAKRAQGEFDKLFNKEQFTANVKNIVLEAFNKGDRDIDEDEIIMPIHKVLKQISTPKIQLDYTEYIDELDSRFKGGVAKNEEIHELNKIQGKLLNDAEKAVKTQMEDEGRKFMDILNNQAVSFADEIERGFLGEIEKLKTQIADKEKYIDEYRRFRGILQELKEKLKV